MRKRLTILYPFSSLIAGLILTQILATVHVYLSNTVLYDSLLAIKNAGYLIIPNQHVMARLHNIGPAFLGGFFFTFSIGAGISFFSLALAWIWDRFFCRKKYILYLYLLLWLGFLIFLNIGEFKLFLTLYVLLIPPTVFTIASKSMSFVNRQNRRPNEIIHIMLAVVLALFLVWQIDSQMFTDFRDIFLLSNPVGSKINDFYYKYTLYPAEIFKSLNQKMLKTCSIGNIKDAATRRSLENILLNYDYIPIEGEIDPDLKLTSIKNDFIFENHDKTVLRISSKVFFDKPDPFIREFEKESDTYPLFRQMTYISLLTGFPLTIYIVAQGLITLILGFILRLSVSSVIASAFCFVLCVILIFTFQLYKRQDVSTKNIAEALNSSRWQTRVAALKIIDAKGLEISQFKTYPKLLKSPHTAERYWLARTLGNSRSPATYNDLMIFFRDAHPNVVTMALYAIGKRGNKRAIDKIMQFIATSDDWYCQWYAYRALRSIGWRQTKSN